MADAAELARALAHGWIPAAAAPELDAPELRHEVARRLAAAGHELQRAGAAWLALPRAAPAAEGIRLRAELEELDHALLCACYLHLVFLPSEHDEDPARDDRGIPAQELVEAFMERGHPKGEVEAALRRVCHAGWARRAGGRLFAEPALLALDRRALHDALGRRLLRRRVARLGRRHPAAVEADG